MFMAWIWIASIIATMYIADQKKLSVVGYFFISLLTGPLAVIIVLLMSSRKAQLGSNLYEVNSLQEATRQLRDLQYSMYAQEEKIKNLEILINKLSGLPANTSLEKETKLQTMVVKPAQVPTVETQEPPSASVKKSDMELDFGRNWLNKIGIVVLALGVAFLISYTFKYFGPFLKIVFGYAVGGALFFAGIKLEAKDKLMKYGRALLGGAWAIIYFTTYAMHHFETSRIIANQGADVFLLALVVAGMMTHVLKYKSEGMMSMVLVVAYLTSTICQITSFTIVGLLFLAVLALFLVYKFQWVKTLSLGMFLTYGIHFIWVMPNLLSSAKTAVPLGVAASEYYDFMNFIFLSCYWAVFLVGVHLVRTIKEPILARSMAATNSGNIVLYSVLSYPLLLRLFYAQRFAMVLSAGLIYLTCALLMKRFRREKMYVSDIAAAVFAITFSISLKFLQTSTLLMWMIEIPFLLFIGINFKERVFRCFSYILSVIVAVRLLFLGFEYMPDVHFLGLIWTWHGFMYFWASMSMAGCFYLTQRPKKDSVVGNIDLIFDQIFSFASCLYLSIWIWSLVHQPWLAFSLSMQGWAFLVIGVLLGLRRFRAYSYLAFGSSAMIFLCEPIHASVETLKWFIVSCDVLSILGAYHAVRYFKQHKSRDLFFEYEEELTFVVGFILLVFAVHQYVDSQWISLSLGIASVLMILIGFVGGNKTERMGGMALLALTLGRVVLVDLSGLDIIFKIITLIILGVLFLGVSYVYNRFSIEKK